MAFAHGDRTGVRRLSMPSPASGWRSWRRRRDRGRGSGTWGADPMGRPRSSRARPRPLSGGRRSFLVLFGVMVGPRPHLVLDSSRHTRSTSTSPWWARRPRAGRGRRGTELHDYFSRHTQAKELSRALAVLAGDGLIRGGPGDRRQGPAGRALPRLGGGGGGVGDLPVAGTNRFLRPPRAHQEDGQIPIYAKQAK